MIRAGDTVLVDEVREALGGLHLDVRPLSAAQALVAGDLRAATTALGLALAIELEAELYTTDAALARVDAGVAIVNVRG